MTSLITFSNNHHHPFTVAQFCLGLKVRVAPCVLSCSHVLRCPRGRYLHILSTWVVAGNLCVYFCIYWLHRFPFIFINTSQQKIMTSLTGQRGCSSWYIFQFLMLIRINCPVHFFNDCVTVEREKKPKKMNESEMVTMVNSCSQSINFWTWTWEVWKDLDKRWPAGLKLYSTLWERGLSILITDCYPGFACESLAL